MHAELKVTAGPFLGSVVSLPLGKFLIGRAVDCQLRPDSETISRYHCVFKLDSFSLRVRDMGSRNGTEVNDRRIASETQLVAGDRVRLGEMEMQVTVLEPKSNAPKIALPEASPEPSEADTTQFHVREHAGETETI